MRKAGYRYLSSLHTCPWWLVGILENPLRRAVQRPERILAGLVEPGQIALDLGPGVGYFSLPLARMVGPNGKVIAADLQPQMLAGLRQRAEQAELLERIVLHQTQPERIGVRQPVDFTLAFWMLHEVRDPVGLLGEVYHLLRPGGRLLLTEPVGHVGSQRFAKEIALAEAQGFRLTPGPRVAFSRAALLVKEK